jgi:hypothetical protein
VAALALGDDVEEAGGVDVDVAFATVTDVSRCGKLAALEALLATWYHQPVTGARNKARKMPAIVDLF